MSTVASLLNRKNEDTVITALSTYELQYACQIMRDHNIGALVVVNRDNQVVGILSERDIARAFSDAGERIIDLTVGNVMTENVVSISPKASVYDARLLMKEGGFRHLPVTLNGDLVGIISISDVLEAIATEAETLAENLEKYIMNG